MDYVCEKCGTLGWENELKNWHQRKTGCDGRIVKVGTIQKDPPEREVNLPEHCMDGKLDKAERPDRADVVVEKQVSSTPIVDEHEGDESSASGKHLLPKQRWDREKYKANHREYMRKRRAK